MFLFDRFYFNSTVWYGCYNEKDKINCFGPFYSYDNACITMQYKMGGNLCSTPSIKDISYSINRTCLFMPEFIRQYKIRNKVSYNNIPIIFN